MNNYLKEFVNKKFQSPGRALDLGAGDFRDVNGLKKLGWDIVGIDKRTGIDLENFYLSEQKPFDLVYSNYVLQKIKNKDQFIKTMNSNLKPEGKIFIHTFDKSDKNSSSNIDSRSLKVLLEKGGFKNIFIKAFDFFDNDVGHKHQHKILEATATK